MGGPYGGIAPDAAPIIFEVDLRGLVAFLVLEIGISFLHSFCIRRWFVLRFRGELTKLCRH